MSRKLIVQPGPGAISTVLTPLAAFDPNSLPSVVEVKLYRGRQGDRLVIFYFLEMPAWEQRLAQWLAAYQFVRRHFPPGRQHAGSGRVHNLFLMFLIKIV